jgi:beta-phosphoglucomutase
MTIKGLIFDLDGVIADTHEYHYRSWKRLADEEGLAFSHDDNDAIRGLTREASLRRVLGARQVTDDQALELMERKNRYYHESMLHIQPLPGVIALLEEARGAGMVIGLGSVSRNARKVLEYLRLIDKFDFIGDGYTVANPKPAPDIFIRVAGELGLLPNEALVLEDSEAGVEAGLQGGFFVLGIGSAPVQKAHVILPTLAGLSLADLLAKFQPPLAEK